MLWIFSSQAAIILSLPLSKVELNLIIEIVGGRIALVCDGVKDYTPLCYFQIKKERCGIFKIFTLAVQPKLDKA